MFFGRERLVAELVARLAGAPLLGIVGPSGSGKSSALRAGLVAAIGAGVLPGQRALGARAAPPGRAPRRSSRRTPIAAERPAVLAVDQFEELFTACRDERERAAFVDALVAPRATRRRGRARRRAGRLLRRAAPRYPELARLLGANHVLVGPMRATSCGGRSSCPRGAPACASSPGSSTRWSPTSRTSRARCRCSRPRCSSCGTRDGRLRWPPTSAPAACAARWRGWPSAPTGGSTPSSSAVARRILLRLAGDGEAPVVRRRVAARRARGRRRGRRARRAGRRAPRHGRRRRGRGRARGAAARVAAPARLARGGRRGPAAAPAPRRTPRATGTRRPRSRRALPRRAAGRRAGVGRRARAGAQRARARFLDESRAARASAPQRRLRARARRRRRAAGARGRRRRRRARPARRRARRGDRPPMRSASAPRRSPRTTSTARCCSRARAWRWTTRCRRAATCSPRCSRARPRSACCTATATGDRLDLSPDERTLATGHPPQPLFHMHAAPRAGAPPCTRASGRLARSRSAPTAAGSPSRITPTTGRAQGHGHAHPAPWRESGSMTRPPSHRAEPRR